MTNDELQQLIEKAAQEDATSLDLSWKRLTELPESIGKLTQLKKLNLSGNQLSILPESIGCLSNLEILSLNQNPLSELPTSIGQLNNLIELELWQNKLRKLPESIGNLANLCTLHLSHFHVSDEYWFLISKLRNLKILYLWQNSLTKISKEIALLNQLKKLYIGYNEIKILAEEIGELSHLSYLGLNNNHVTSLPESISQLTQLNTLDLSNNQLSSLPEPIGQLTQLTTLNLSGNQLTSLPESIGQLTQLTTLDLSHNQLTSLPESIGRLTKLTQFNLFGNTLTTLPPEIRWKDGLEILRFYQQRWEQSIDRLYEAKLLIIGEAGAGKTSLAKKIEDETYELQPDETSTDGIDIIQYRFPLDNGKEFRVNIWDFGGQQIYHETHQFFLTKRSLYALVADARKEDTDFYYWLKIVELLSDNSPLLIIKNEKQNIPLSIDERQLRGEFTNLKETLATNLATNRGLPEILTQIKHYITHLPHVGDELPRTWVKVREVLEQDPRNHIPVEIFLQICQDNGFTRNEDKLQLSSYLHDLGVCLHFQADDLLAKTVILKPTWGTDAVYKVLRNPQVNQNRGKFTRADLATIWQDEKYAPMHRELLRLMMNFKLCYEIPGQPGTYIAPQLLSPESPDYDWDDRQNLLLRYEYEFMPKGILTRFIVEMHRWIEQQTLVWKTGVVLAKDGARAEVTERYRYHKGEIRIRVSGYRQRDLLTTVRHELDKIHATYERLKYNTLVPCNCNTCKGSQEPFFYELKDLYEFMDNQQDQIQCRRKPFKMVSVRSLIDDATLPINCSDPHQSDRARSSHYHTHFHESVGIVNIEGTTTGQQTGIDSSDREPCD
ncbi:COR domain-containing protein [Trichothermofontia sp.]